MVPYLVTMAFYDGVVGGEDLIYALEPFVPLPGSLLWELGNVATYYLVALAVGHGVRIAGRARREEGRDELNDDSPTSQ